MSPVEKAYEEYKQRNDKTKRMDGRLYYRIVSSAVFELTGFEEGCLLVIPSPEMPQKKNAVYQDENGNHFVLGGRTHIRFSGQIPRWYFECGECHMKWQETKDIGNYLTMV